MSRRWRPLGLYRVAGESMLPQHRPGDVLVGWRWSRPRVGAVVVVWRAQKPLIKRLVKITNDQIWVEGDNAPSSTDSRQFGPLPRQCIEAVIIAKLRGPHEAA